jgi:hypothetical protein
MAKVIISERQYSLIKKYISETIDPSEAYREDSSVQTILDGKRGVCFLVLYSRQTKELFDKAIKAGLNYISIPQREGSFGKTIANVIYRDGYEEDAMRLAKIVRNNEGYLPTNTPEETYEIGILLGYNPEKVKEFVLDKFPNYNFY